jgi:O-antigen/teichoic acid export membrane protein
VRLSALKLGALKLAGGAGLSQVIVVLATPLLTRLFSPYEFGEFALFASLYALLVGVATLKFEQALVLPGDDETSLGLARLTLACSAIGALVALAGLVLADRAWQALAWYQFILPAALFLGALVSVAQQWCLRVRDYGPIAASGIAGALANVGSVLLLYAAGWRDGALILGYVAGLVVTAVYLWRGRGALLASIVRSSRSPWPLFAEYRQFPAHVLPGALATAIAGSGMPIVVTHYAGAAAAGLYAIANRLLALPAILVGNAVQSVFYSELGTRLNAGQDVRGFFLRTLGALAGLALPGFALLWWLSPWLFRWVFGPDFVEAGHYARYLCIGVAAAFIAIPLAPVFIALRRTRAGLLLQLASSLGPIVAFALGFQRGGMETGLVWFTLAWTTASAASIGMAAHAVLARSAAA